MAGFAVNLAVGFAAQTIIGLFGSDQKIEGQRLEDLSAPKSSYGTAVPRIWGTVRVTGNLFWAADIREDKRVKKSGGGFLGLGPKTIETQYKYYGYFAHLFCAGPVERIKRVWLNDELKYDPDNGEDDITRRVRFYLGTEDQTPDQIIVDKKPSTGFDYGLPQDEQNRALALSILKDRYGITEESPLQTPAYRGLCYLVADKLSLTDYNNSFPSVSAEIVAQSDCRLSRVLSDICTDCGLLPEEIDVSEVASIPVTGYVQNGLTSGREAIQMLQQAYDFDLIQSAGVLRFLPRSRSFTAINIDSRDLGASANGSRPQFHYTWESPEVNKLLSEVDINYLDLDLDYQENSKYARSVTADYENKLQISFPLVMGGDTAKGLAHRLLRDSFADSQQWKDIELPPSYWTLEPADVILFPVGDTTQQLKITEVGFGVDGLIKLKATELGQRGTIEYLTAGGLTLQLTVSPGSNYTVDGVPVGVADTTTGQVYAEGVDYRINGNSIQVLADGAIAANTPITVLYQGKPTPPVTEVVGYASSDLGILDIPLISQFDSDYTLYFSALRSAVGNWFGADIYFSTNNTDYNLVESIPALGTIGTVTAIDLGTGTITVRLDAGELETITREQIERGEGLAAINQSVLTLRDVNPLGNGVYQLTNWTSGEFGSDPVPNQTGTRFVLLTGDGSALVGLQLDSTFMGQTLYFKAVTFGKDLEDVEFANTILYRALSQRPLPPHEFRATVDQRGNITLEWSKRDRHLLDSDRLTYQLQFLNGQTVVRTLDTAETKFTYTADGQQLDWGNTINTLTVRAYSTSSWGQSQPATYTLTPTSTTLPPRVDGFEPTTAATDDVVTVTGDYFNGVSEVKVGDQSILFWVVNEMEIQFTVTDTISSGLIYVDGVPSPYPLSITKVEKGALLAENNLADVVDEDAAAANLSVISLTQLGQPGGVASLGNDGLVPSSQLPPVVPSSNYIVTELIANLPYTLTAADHGKNKIASGTGTINLPAGLTAGWWCNLILNGTGNLTIAPTASVTIKFSGGSGANKLKKENGAVTILHESNNNWRVFGANEP